MKEIMIIETNKSNEHLHRVKHLIKDFYFDGGNLFFICINNTANVVQKILETEFNLIVTKKVYRLFPI